MWRPGSTMTMSTDRKASVKLAALSIVLAGIPLVALGWLGGRLLAQDRALESQRRRRLAGFRRRCDAESRGALLAGRSRRTPDVGCPDSRVHAAAREDVS